MVNDQPGTTGVGAAMHAGIVVAVEVDYNVAHRPDLALVTRRPRPLERDNLRGLPARIGAH